MPTRVELNTKILNEKANKFREPYNYWFKCVLRPLERGEGLVINKERLRSIEATLSKAKDQARWRCFDTALRDMGITETDAFYKFELENPRRLSKEEMEATKHSYYKKHDECVNKGLKNIRASSKDDVMCLAIGEKIKSIHSTSFMPAKLMFGEHVSFLTEEERNKTEDIGSIFNEVWKTGKYFPKKEDPIQIPVSEIEAMYGITARDISIGKRRLNAVAREIMR